MRNDSVDSSERSGEVPQAPLQSPSYETYEDARQLRLHAAGLTYSDTTAEAEAKHRLREIAMRIETGYYTQDAVPKNAHDMVMDWLADADDANESLRRHLRAVLEIAMTWRPDYATVMDLQTIAHAAVAASDRRLPERKSDAAVQDVAESLRSDEQKN
jgi:hypothetical protein